jgi:glycosyltransferase involved in cell wall biosynthesis
MKVLLATNSTDRGSTSRTLEAWARLLPAHGVEITVTVGGTGQLLDALQEAGVPVFVHPIRQHFTWRRPRRFLEQILRLAWRIRALGIDLLHVNEEEHYQVPAYAAYLAGVPVVVHARFLPNRAMCRWLFKRPCIPQRVFFTSLAQMRDCGDAVAAAVPTEHFRLLPNGLDIARYGNDHSARERVRSAWGLDPATLVVGTASALAPIKRIDHVIRAVVALAREGLDVRGFVAGQTFFEGEDELLRLRQLVRDLGADGLITFLGWVEPVEPLFHAWDVCVSTSQYESFGMTMLEAMAVGCPVVAYSVGALPEVIGQAGLLVKDGDEQALLASLRALADPQRRREFAARGRARARYFDIQDSVVSLVHEYREVLNSGSQPTSGDALSPSVEMSVLEQR